MPHASRVSWIGHLDQPLQQARDLPGHSLGVPAELVKGRWNRLLWATTLPVVVTAPAQRITTSGVGESHLSPSPRLYRL
ncbi:hypothetical protein [Streptomyces abikoensis]|uniref:hypothetical protein n=1 Tax=Streptomyces abikoensis TaxID=97398 RepID=UPI0033E10A9C